MAEIDTEALLQSIDERIAAHVAPLAEGFNALSALTQQDRTVLNELAGNNRRMQAEVATLFDSTLPAEEREAARARITERLTGQEAEAESKAVKAENERLKAAVAAKTEAKPAQAAKQPDEQTAREATYMSHYYRPLSRYAAEQGLEYKDVFTHPDYPTRMPQLPNNGGDDWDTFDRGVRAVIVKLSDERHAAENNGRTIIETTASSGSGRGTPKDNYLKLLKEGKPMPPADEIDRIVASLR